MTLAEDLVTAAAQAIRQVADPDYTADARAATTAVLRGVVAQLRSDGVSGTPDWLDAYTQAANDLEMLADDIEGTARQAGTP